MHLTEAIQDDHCRQSISVLLSGTLYGYGQNIVVKRGKFSQLLESRDDYRKLFSGTEMACLQSLSSAHVYAPYTTEWDTDILDNYK